MRKYIVIYSTRELPNFKLRFVVVAGSANNAVEALKRKRPFAKVIEVL